MRGLRRWLEPVALTRLVATRWTEVAAYTATIVSCLAFANFALDRHRVFESNAYDFGFFDQIIWNTSHGRWFETSFTPHNFLGQHFQPVLLMFALAYRLGASIELLLITQAVFVAAAAVPLYYAVRKATSSGNAALAMSVAFLISPQLHHALDFDFHPELVGFFWVFLALYFVVARRPVAAIVSLLPLLLLKEDMPLILGAFAVLIFARGFRREGMALFAIAAGYAVVVVLVLMPWIRGGSGDLTERYGYLVADSTWWSIVPDVTLRSLQQLWAEPLAAILRLGASVGFLGLLSPLAMLVAVPSYLLAALSDHPQQSRLELHYAMAPLALTWVAAVLGLQRLARVHLHALRATNAARVVGASVVLICSIVAFVLSSPYSPRSPQRAPNAAHQALISRALELIPADGPVSAQGTLLPHLSQRQHIYEFPDLQDAEFVVVDPSLPTTGQTREAGYEREIDALTKRGYEVIFNEDGVKVFRRAR